MYYTLYTYYNSILITQDFFLLHYCITGRYCSLYKMAKYYVNTNLRNSYLNQPVHFVFTLNKLSQKLANWAEHYYYKETHRQ